MSREPRKKMPKYPQIEIVNRQRGYRIDRRRLISVVRTLLAEHNVRAGEVEIAIVNDAEIARLNEHYLGHRGPTDVLSFDLSDGHEEGVRGKALTGQIIVSADTARRQAKRLGHSIAAELTLYVIHGLLHLLGCDDLAEPQRTEMHRRQKQLAERLGIRLKE